MQALRALCRAPAGLALLQRQLWHARLPGGANPEPQRGHTHHRGAARCMGHRSTGEHRGRRTKRTTPYKGPGSTGVARPPTRAAVHRRAPLGQAPQLRQLRHANWCGTAQPASGLGGTSRASPRLLGPSRTVPSRPPSSHPVPRPGRKHQTGLLGPLGPSRPVPSRGLGLSNHLVPNHPARPSFTSTPDTGQGQPGGGPQHVALPGVVLRGPSWHRFVWCIVTWCLEVGARGVQSQDAGVSIVIMVSSSSNCGGERQRLSPGASNGTYRGTYCWIQPEPKFLRCS